MAGVIFHQPQSSGIKPSLRVDRFFASDGSMRKRKRGKTVTWPPDEKICEVRLYNNLSENLSVEQSIVQGVFQNRCSVRDKVDLITGLKVTRKRARRNESPVVSVTAERPWCCPPKILLEGAWMVAEGDESMEISIQLNRERKELEAIYPRTSSIPYSPIEPQVDFQNVDDASIPQIPIIAVEDEDEYDGNSISQIPNIVVEDEDEYDGNVQVGGCLVGDRSARDCPNLSNNEATIKQNHDSHNEFHTTDHGTDKVKSAADPEIAAAAAAACMAIKAVGGSSLVDEELLVKILTNPALLESLLVHGKKPVKQARESHIGLMKDALSNESNREPQNVVPNTCLAAVGGIMHEKIDVTPFTFVGNSVVSSSHTASNAGVQVLGAEMHLRPAECTLLPPASICQEESAVSVSRRQTLADYSNRHVPEIGATLVVREVNVNNCVPTRLPTKGHALPSFQVSHQYPQQQAKVSVLSNRPSLTDWKSSPNIPRAVSTLFWQQKPVGNLNAKCNETKPMQVNTKLCLDAINNQNASPERRDSCNKSRKPCVYFHSRRGCKKGVNCHFLHQSMQSEMENRCTSFVR